MTAPVSVPERLYRSPIGLLPSWWERFAVKVEVTEGCWFWTAGRYPGGYGMFGVKAGMTRQAHRLAYEGLVGPIPEGLDLDHLCRVRHCVRPDHLEPVTRRTNLLRGEGAIPEKAAQTHCIYGHEFTPENTYRYPKTGYRRCRACARERYRVNSK